jgi:hypothetical protein
MDRTRKPVEGDFLYTSWGYDQTNVTFYRVVGLTPSGKSLRLQQCATTRQPFGSQERVLPLPQVARWTHYDRETGEPTTTTAPVHTVRWQGDHAKVEGHYAWLSDGAAQYATAPGWGH